MRVRLLLDVDVVNDDIGVLADLIATQPGATVDIEGFRPLGARFMGAQPVPFESSTEE